MVLLMFVMVLVAVGPDDYEETVQLARMVPLV
jgi:hypothetical protein